MKWSEWRCPVCPDWGCGASSESGVTEGKRLHQRVVHDGLTFREAVRERLDALSDVQSPMSNYRDLAASSAESAGSGTAVDQ